MIPDRMQRQRFELKYLLDEPTALRLRDFVLTYLELDEAGVGKPDGAYRVNSLYLDSEQYYTFWDWVNSNRNRFKLRMRFYDPDPDSPLFLEIKRRVGGCILKQRCGIRKQAAPLVLAEQFPPATDLLTHDPKGLVALERFLALIGRFGARPQALVTYMREAYVDPVNDGIRVTLDREVRISPRTTCDLSLRMDRFSQPFGEKVILELKFNNRFPDWFGQMVQLFNLTRAAAAKYCEGLAAFRYPELGNCPPTSVPRPALPGRAEDENALSGSAGLTGSSRTGPRRLGKATHPVSPCVSALADP